MQEQRWLTFLNRQICLSEHLLWTFDHKIRGVQQKVLSTSSIFLLNTSDVLILLNVLLKVIHWRDYCRGIN